MGRAKVADLDAKFAKGDDLFLVEGFRWELDAAIAGFFAVVTFHAFEDLWSAILEFVGSILVGQNGNALVSPIAVAQHGMALAVLVDHQLYRLVGNFLDLFVKCLSKLVRGAGIDDDHTVASDDE